MASELQRPPQETNPEGRPRRVGVELEFSGVPVEHAAALVQALFGGSVRLCDRYRRVVEGTPFGDFTVELDASYAHPPEGELAGTVGGRLRAEAAPLIGDVMRLWMPNEVIAPPVPFERLPALDRLVAALRGREAHGTGDSPVAGFSLQLNIEVAAEDAGYLTRQLQAYLLLSPWLRARAGRDLTRRILRWAAPFPDAYVRKVLAPDYRPDLDALVDDYLDANATRNRELDLLPLLAHLRPDRVRARWHEERHLSARPAFHWRLPDSRIDEPAWEGIVGEWNHWVLVERLAADDARLAAALADRRASPAGWSAETVAARLPDLTGR